MTISKKLAIGYYGVPFNLVIVVTDLITIMVKKRAWFTGKGVYCGVDSFQIYESVYIWQVVKLLSSPGLKIWLWSTLMS